jgi:hypothetical protein
MPFDGVPNQHGLASLGLARDSLSRPGGWCQGGESINGAQCAMRALATIADNAVWHDAYRRLRQALPDGYGSVAAYNDTPGRTQADIVALYDRAIKL